MYLLAKSDTLEINERFNLKIGEKYNFQFGKIQLLEDDVIVIRYNKGGVVQFDEVKSTGIFIGQRLDIKKKYYVIIDLTTEIITFSKNTNKSYIRDANMESFKYMDIIICPNWISKIKMKVYLKLNKSQLKTKTARNLNQALIIIDNHRKAYIS